MLQFKNLRVLLLICLISALYGCAAAAIIGVAATATGASSAIDRRTTGTQIEDQAIEFKAASAINSDVELDDQAHINITSYNTIVLLTGETPTESMRDKALELVKSIKKITHVYNEITIAAPSSIASRSSDTYLTSKVKTKLLAHEDITGLEIKVVTEKGTVYLMGIVSKAEAENAATVASQTGGVQKVVKLFQYEN